MNPALGAALARLPGRKLILTDGTPKHADAVMRKLAVHEHFEDVFDIVAAELEPKPSPKTYERFLARHDVDPRKAAMFEDLARNLEALHALGMVTVLVVPGATRPMSIISPTTLPDFSKESLVRAGRGLTSPAPPPTTRSRTGGRP